MENRTIIDQATDPAMRQSTTASAPSPQVQINDSGTYSGYANFCRISGTPEEVLIDFGLNPQPVGTPQEPIMVSQRIVTNWYTAKRLLHALQISVARHEAVFGVLETDVQRRVARPLS